MHLNKNRFFPSTEFTSVKNILMMKRIKNTIIANDDDKILIP